MLAVMVLYASFAETFMTAVQRMKMLLELVPAEKYKGTKTVSSEWPTTPVIEFKNVNFRYWPEGPLILKDVSFSVPPRAKVGIVGRTGAGKSTITISLFRLCELSGGSIEIDGENISTLDLHTLRSKLAIIPQDPVLFEGNVRFNLDPFEFATDAEIWKVLEAVHLKAAIERVQGGLRATVLPGGSNFSVGERQLFCLARALLRKCNILILDEATASIDQHTDALIQKMIRTEFAHCTVLTIAHRINTITDSDYILVLQDGRLAEYDTPQNLLQKPDSIYTSLLRESSGQETQAETQT